MSDDLNRQIFKEEAYDLLGELEGALLELEESPDDMALVNQIFRALHTIKGSGSMFGFDDIAAFTHEVESTFDMVRNNALGVTPELCGLALRSRDYIKLLLGATEGDEVDSTERQAILQGLQALCAGEPVAGAVTPDPADAPAPPEAVQASYVSDEPLAGEFCEYRITLTPKAGTKTDESSLESLFVELGGLGDFQILGRPGDTAAGGWNLSLKTDITADNVRDVFFFVDADLAVDISDSEGMPVLVTGALDVSLPAGPARLKADEAAFNEDEDLEAPRLGEILIQSGDVTEADIRDALSKQKPLGQILAEEGKVAPEKVEQAVRRQAEAKEQDASRKQQEALSSIRVAADKLDYLVDLVGELVIVQAQITQVVSERNDPTMTALAEELERLSDELRDSTLGIRMLPIGTSYSKFRRLVRDLSGSLGKEINLVTVGADTELDKTVIERLGDPLVHLLRNSIGHGIELPDERKAQGKPAQGTIYLSAEHSGGEVLVRIKDDGRGMDPTIIREKGIERGLIAADAELTKKDLLKLIFEPGFSTAKEVTNVSGRGVGMDVVKRAIDSLRGSIEIDSTLGKGTFITIRLPLTLAIIDGLQVRVGDGYYVIPLSLVEECVELAASDMDESSRQRILHLRGEIVPYVHLRDWFGVEGDSPPIEQIVITGVEGSRVGIVVDTVIGEHQTVIKSLSRVYKDVEGISGATIKGDGSIALILDIPSLVRRIIVESS
ncbi:MAG: chemotaxis protein CheA [Pseudodesulfovibrio sp.]|uniref:Chemotaxis protein CheA n=1 Tax=Pseudodesulfovibrio aespoeensis (strain ATCC 700646 / DSM 10631 / Aspo-2) TaxID=643562 RepID=E6VZ53_PSEA9|nr:MULTISPECIES: chemotaxis protein CheA [Pseudodesulfovibrio]MBU4245124.1 chemotaxis protein CheA [Pseudomonadota bacterium]ADU62829.1 CheW domain protein [Pseudodesulfovibrio aespoeensis Aspo-2]MBU4379727.1 chemotaxis protein CheA [Pseudomonadota bacterium]MBU4474600.1 chemotaxis protein CheA [Pseudomonadota bacterium]MBU4514927.1 chemotaxis protein CheA [Pseudomonadota bacterium]